MDRETQAHIFEPFFTTKDTGKGTGLGLATVYGIVKQSGGFIWVYSEPNKGTTFKIYLPMVDEEPDDHETKDLSHPKLKGDETILIVEDEEDVRALIHETLRLYGYDVLDAPHGDSALILIDKFSDKITLIITDVVMPKMSGRELVDKVISKHPGMKVLYMSGYTDNAIVHKGLLEAGTQFIQKPFTPLALLRKVREVLEGP
jgi:CheY-like chemotaxis protein